mgnify:CR=1 FL=1
MELDSVKHPVKHNTPVPPESRDALESLTFGAEAMDEAEHITAMTELFGHTATFSSEARRGGKKWSSRW